MRTFTFDTITDYRQAKYDGVTSGQTPEGIIHATLVGDTSVKSGSVVSKIKTGETFVDSINPFVTPDLGTDGDTIYKITDNGVVKYMYLRKGKTTWDSESFGQVYIDASRLLPSGSTSYSLVTNQSQVFTYADTKTEATGSGRARIAKIKGNSLGWNQLAKMLNNSNLGVSLVVNSDESYTLSGTATGGNAELYFRGSDFAPAGHKLLFWSRGFSTAYIACYGPNYSAFSQTGLTPRQSCIVTGNTTLAYLQIRVTSGQTVNETVRFMLFDLTLMFGAGNEPATVEEFEALFPNPYYAYDAGSLLNFKGTGVKVVGFNQWDEEWEVGAYNSYGEKATTDGYVAADSTIRNKNLVRVLPGNYYSEKQVIVFFYDSLGTYIASHPLYNYGTFALNVTNGNFTIPDGVAYINFRFASSYGTTYNHDICINLSGPRNGQYEPYKSSIIPINITSLRDKATHNLIFPNGLLSAGSVYDEIDLVRRKAIKRVGRVDLGAQSWEYLTNPLCFRTTNNPLPSTGTGGYITGRKIQCAKYASVGQGSWDILVDKSCAQFWSNVCICDSSAGTDPTTFKTAMSGVMLNYALATPVEYDLSIPLFGTYPADEYTTKQLLPINGETPTTSPMSIEIQQL